MERDEVWPHNRPNKPGLNADIPGQGPSSQTIVLRVKGLLELFLQSLVSTLQLMNFSQKAAEAQVKGLQDADVRPQVVTQSHGGRCRWWRAVETVVEMQVREPCGRQTVRCHPRVLAQEDIGVMSAVK